MSYIVCVWYDRVCFIWVHGNDRSLKGRDNEKRPFKAKKVCLQLFSQVCFVCFEIRYTLGAVYMEESQHGLIFGQTRRLYKKSLTFNLPLYEQNLPG